VLLLLTAPSDAHADFVATKLRARDVAFVRFDPADFPRTSEVAIRYGSPGRDGLVLRAGGATIDLEQVRAVWYRRPGAPTADAAITEPAARKYVELESSLVMQDLWTAIPARWLPGRPLEVRRADHKATQLRLARTLGFELPPTLMTNSPRELLEFHREHGGRIIGKHAATGFPSAIGPGLVRYTERVTPRDLAHVHELAYCPMTFQAYVPKRIELRVTVVGAQVFAAEIHSQATHHTQFDWRRYDPMNTPHLPHALPADIEARCLALVARLGLCYGAIDLIVTPDERYVFLEINPNGQYLFIEERTGLPISDAICDLLTSGDPS
jgi:hypothetical protein